MNKKRIETINISFLVVIGMIILLFSYRHLNYFFGWTIGGLLGIINFKLICYFLSKPMDSFFARNLARSRRIRFLIIALAMLLSVLYPHVLNIITLFLGFMVHKIAILICQIIETRQRSVKINE